MDYERALNLGDSPKVNAAIIAAIEQLFEQHRNMLQVNVSERAIAAQLAGLLKPFFANHDIDVEYNRMGEAVKAIAWNEQPEKVFPDIIVHVRLTNESNILVIELKKSSNLENKIEDVQKLKAYRRELHYQHALFIRLGVGEDAGTVSECEWIEI